MISWHRQELLVRRSDREVVRVAHTCSLWSRLNLSRSVLPMWKGSQSPEIQRSRGASLHPSNQPGCAARGKVNHPAWRDSIVNGWDEKPKRLLIVEKISVGARKSYDEPLPA